MTGPNTTTGVRRSLEIAVCTVPMMGHMMPLLPYASELLQRGHSVTFFHDTHPKYRKKLESCGLMDHSSRGRCDSIAYDSSSCSPKGSWGGAIYDTILSHYEHRKPDVIVYDFFAYDAADAADRLGVPAVGVYPNPRSVNPWAASVKQQESLQWKVWCKFMWGMEGVLARILWCNRNWKRWKRSLRFLPEQDMYPSPYMPRPIIGCMASDIELPNLPDAPKFYAVGPSLPNNSDPIESELMTWLEAQQGNSKPIVYVAFGTMFKHTTESVRKLEADLMAMDDVAVLWSLPERDQESLICMQQKGSNNNILPPNWKIQSYLPQVSLLQSGKIAAFVTHCGSNSISESLLSGVPMVCCPGFADQPANATRLARAGVGVIAKKGIDGVGAALKTLLDDIDAMTETSRRLAQKLSSNGAAARAATLIETIGRDEDGGEAIGTKGRWPWWPVVVTAAVLPFVL